MTLCATCDLETKSAGPPSPGPVDDSESVFRAAYDPSAGKLGKVRASLIDKKALARGELSVWRAGGSSLWSTKALSSHVENLPPLPDRQLFGMIGVQAGALRSIRAANTRVCVLDETICDTVGSRHEQHAHISPCRRQHELPIHPDCDEIRALKDAIWAAFNLEIQSGGFVRIG